MSQGNKNELLGDTLYTSLLPE